MHLSLINGETWGNICMNEFLSYYYWVTTPDRDVVCFRECANHNRRERWME